MIERSLLPSVPVGSGRHVMRLGHGGERAVGRATGGACASGFNVDDDGGGGRGSGGGGGGGGGGGPRTGRTPLYLPDRNGFGNTLFNV